MRAAVITPLADVLFVVVDDGPYFGGPNGDYGPGPSGVTVTASRGGTALIGKWEIMAEERPDGTKRYFKSADPYITITRDLATGHLAILLPGNDAGIWFELEIDPEGRPNLYWLHQPMELPPCPPGPALAGESVLAALWQHPGIVQRPDGTGVLTDRIPLVFEVDEDMLRVADAYDFPNLWPLPELAAKRERSGATYYKRVKDKR